MANIETTVTECRPSVLQTIKESMPEDWGMLLSAFAASYGIGLLVLLGLPFMIGATIDDFGLSESKAGFLGTVECLAIMAASVSVAPFMNRVPRRTLAFFGVVLAIVGNLLCTITDPLTYSTLIVFRIVAGLGCGLSLAAGTATISNAKNREKMAGQMSVLFAFLTAIVVLLFSWLTEMWGYKGMYAALAGCMLCVSPFLLRLPQHAAAQLVIAGGSHSPQKILSISTFLLLAGMFLFSLRDMAGWAFVERIGVEVGYSTGEVGRLLSIQAILGISGPLLASIIGSRFGLKIPLSLGLFFSGLIYFVMLLLPTSMVAYSTVTLFIAFTYFYTLSYLTAAAAEFDSQGRIVAASGGFLSAGMACGSLVGGYLIEQYGYNVTSWAILAMTLLSVIFVVASLQTFKNR